MLTLRLLSGFAVSLIASSAWAQVDPIPYVNIGVENQRYGEQLRRNLGITPNARANGVAMSSARYSSIGRGYFARPAPVNASAISFGYRSTPALRRSAADGYVERTTRCDPEAGRIIVKEIARNDFPRNYAGIVAPFGYRANDTADAVAAYTLLGWLIAIGASDRSLNAARAVRDQVAQGLVNDPRFADPRTRAELAEEMKLLFVTLHAGWQSARKEGNLRPYGDGVAGMFRQFTGNDLRAMRLTERGFVRG